MFIAGMPNAPLSALVSGCLGSSWAELRSPGLMGGSAAGSFWTKLDRAGTKAPWCAGAGLALSATERFRRRPMTKPTNSSEPCSKVGLVSSAAKGTGAKLDEGSKPAWFGMLLVWVFGALGRAGFR